MAESRWARASREDLEALADACDRAVDPSYSALTTRVLEALRDSCPPLRTEAEVAAELLDIMREYVKYQHSPLWTGFARALDIAKEPTRG